MFSTLQLLQAFQATFGEGVISVLVIVAIFIAVLSLLFTKPAQWVLRGIFILPFTKNVEATIDKRMEPVLYQLNPNGGTSLRDRIDAAIEQQQKLMNYQDNLSTTMNMFFEMKNHATFRTDTNGTVVTCNQAYLDFWRFGSLGEATSGSWMHQIKTENQDVALERVLSVFEVPRPFTFDNELKDGRKIRFVAEPYNDDSGKFAGYVGAVSELDPDYVLSIDSSKSSDK